MGHQVDAHHVDLGVEFLCCSLSFLYPPIVWPGPAPASTLVLERFCPWTPSHLHGGRSALRQRLCQSSLAALPWVRAFRWEMGLYRRLLDVRVCVCVCVCA